MSDSRGDASAPPGRPTLRTLAAPFATYGIVAGLLAGSLCLPQGCGMGAAESARLRVSLPLTGVIAYVLTAVVITRFRQSKFCSGAAAAVRTWILAGSAALVLAGSATFAASAAAIYAGPRLLDSDYWLAAVELTGVALLVFAPVLGPAVAALPWVVHAARLLESGPVDSPIVRSARRFRWSLVAAATHVACAAVLIGRRVEVRHDPSAPPLDPLLFGAAAAVGGLLLAASAMNATRIGIERWGPRHVSLAALSRSRHPSSEGQGDSEAGVRQKKWLDRASVAAFVLSLLVIGTACAALLLRAT